MKKLFSSALLLSAAALLSSAVHAQAIVCVETNLDSFCLEMLEADAPKATANFLRYVDEGDYTDTLVHSSVRNTYLVGGMFEASLDPIPMAADPAVASEYKLPNDRGTVALVTTPGQPNSATSGWRINVADNSAAFSAANSGAVFARVLGDGMAVVDRLSKLSTHALNSGHLSQAPLLQLDGTITADDLVQVKRMYRYGGTLADFANYGINFPPKDPALVDIRDVVCMETNLGEVCVLMFPEDAPQTVANFLRYVNDGDYNGSFFHRSVSGFVLQGGGFKFGDGVVTEIPADPPVINEYKRPNTVNTIAMAKFGNDPNSATNQWFFNLADNTETLNTANNGGFTVFGEIILSDRRVLNRLAGVIPYNLSSSLGSAFAETPLVNPDVNRSADDFVTIERAFVTQRDIAATEDTTTSPLAKVVALGTYGPQAVAIGARFPVKVGNKIYRVILNRIDGDPNLFGVDLIRIIELKDTGRITATFDGRYLRIPTLRAGDKVYANILLEITNTRTLEFYLHSYEQL
ncbi:MAG: peptidylprolyl isomerase [Pseudomonadota bacterium]